MGDDDESVKLQSGDNEVFSVSKEVACQAVTIKEMLEGAPPPAPHPRARGAPSPQTLKPQTLRAPLAKFCIHR